MRRLISLSILLLSCCLLPGCKKNSPERWEFSFTYNGQTYSNPDDGSPIEGSGDIIGIEIRNPGVLGGRVRFIWLNNCAYLEPTGMSIIFNENTCTYGSNGPIDSSKIFMYSSGSKNTSVSNCRTKKDLFTGGTYSVCAIAGSFSVVLVNNAGVTKTITGNVRDPEVIR